MKYINRLLAKNGIRLVQGTDKNDKNPNSQSVHASEGDREKSAIPPCEVPTETTETISVVSVGKSHGVYANSPVWYVDRNGEITTDATAADLIADLDPEPTDTDADYDANERAAIQEEGCTLTVEVSAYDLLQTLKAKGVRITVHPGGAYVEEQDRLSDIDAKLVRQHNTMLSRWILQKVIRDNTDIKVEIAQWAGFVLPEADWPGRAPRSAYQVTFPVPVAPTPELEGLWALVMDHPPRLYRSPWRAAQGFLRTWKRHQATVRRYRRFGKLKPPGGLAVVG
jgi:hypothetical protein